MLNLLFWFCLPVLIFSCATQIKWFVRQSFPPLVVVLYFPKQISKSSLLDRSGVSLESKPFIGVALFKCPADGTLEGWPVPLYLCTLYHCCTLEGCLPSISTRSVYNAEYNDAPWMAASGRSVWVDSGSSRRVYSPSVFRIYGTTSHQLHKNTALPRWPTSTISTSTGLHQSGNISNASHFLPRCVKISIKHAHIYLNTSKSYSYSND